MCLVYWAYIWLICEEFQTQFSIFIGPSILLPNVSKKSSIVGKKRCASCSRFNLSKSAKPKVSTHLFNNSIHYLSLYRFLAHVHCVIRFLRLKVRLTISSLCFTLNKILCSIVKTEQCTISERHIFSLMFRLCWVLDYCEIFNKRLLDVRLFNRHAIFRIFILKIKVAK